MRVYIRKESAGGGEARGGALRGNSSWKYFSCVHVLRRAGLGMTFPDELSPATDGKYAPPYISYTFIYIYIQEEACISSPPPILPRVLLLPDFFSLGIL